ncbi:MAG TPA: DUF6766 family protein [Polyangiaceae bacterium]
MQARHDQRAESFDTEERRDSNPSKLARVLHDYGLSLVLLSLFTVSMVLQTWMGWRHFESESREHGATAEWFGDDGYIWSWGLSTFENWQSEFLQLLAFVVLTAFLIHKGSHESKDSDEAMQQQLDRIEARLERLTSARADENP